MNAPHVKLTFSTPSNGWLPVTLELGDQSYSFNASNVPNDPIEELYAAIWEASAGRSGLVWWHLEPSGYLFEICGSATGAGLRVFTCAAARGRERREIASAAGTASEILLPMWRALRRFESFATGSGHWSTTELPDLKALGAAIGWQGK